MHEMFRKASEAVSWATGTPAAFIAAAAIILTWGVSGPIFHYSDTWQLVINTGTTIITFLMVFLIQATQNRDTRIVNLKLDELIRAKKGARDDFAALDELNDDDLEHLEAQFKSLSGKYGGLISDDLDAVRAELKRRSAGGEAA